MIVHQSGLRALTVVLQPIRNLRTGGIFGFEALLRGPEARAIPVLGWLEQAAREGWLAALVYRAWELACAAAEEWLTAEEWLFVNWDQRVPLPSDLPRSRVVFELSERLPVAASLVDAIHAMGGHVAMDDFGQGVTSLEAVVQTGVDILKLDYRLTHKVDQDFERQALIKGITDLLRITSPALRIVAEGIETAAEQHAMVACGVPLGQGFFLGRPMPAAACKAVKVSSRQHGGDNRLHEEKRSR